MPAQTEITKEYRARLLLIESCFNIEWKDFSVIQHLVFVSTGKNLPFLVWKYLCYSFRDNSRNHSGSKKVEGFFGLSHRRTFSSFHGSPTMHTQYSYRVHIPAARVHCTYWMLGDLPWTIWCIPANPDLPMRLILFFRQAIREKSFHHGKFHSTEIRKYIPFFRKLYSICSEKIFRFSRNSVPLFLLKISVGVRLSSPLNNKCS